MNNPSDSGGRDQEDSGSRPAWANSSWEPISKTPNPKRAVGVAQVIECLPRVRPWVQTPVPQNKNKNKKCNKKKRNQKPRTKTLIDLEREPNSTSGSEK
jgi:DNA phosphorothioation-dependent restriction protein DptG